MELKSEEVDIIVTLHQRRGLIETAVGYSELIFIESRGNVMMGVCIDIRIDSQAHGHSSTKLFCQIPDNHDFL